MKGARGDYLCRVITHYHQSRAHPKIQSQVEGGMDKLRRNGPGIRLGAMAQSWS